ncbi:unnamed protein product [Gongylonema pulchrum]|uniref:RNA-directed RNA polymerase n=1 Tax=Gongylonema pulchrum TaxID=637853 RepID=A0A183DXK8_9BILA|nr:unnamed protein product [Gongylonema pulchrum]
MLEVEISRCLMKVSSYSTRFCSCMKEKTITANKNAHGFKAMNAYTIEDLIASSLTQKQMITPASLEHRYLDCMCVVIRVNSEIMNDTQNWMYEFLKLYGLQCAIDVILA